MLSTFQAQSKASFRLAQSSKTAHSVGATTYRINCSRLVKSLNPHFARAFENKQRFNIFYGGAGSGKSTFLAQRLLYRILSQQPYNALIVRKTHQANHHSTFPLLRHIIESWGLDELFVAKSNTPTILCKNKNTIAFAGLDDVDKLKSITFQAGILNHIWIEEASQVFEYDFDQLNIRLRGTSPFPFQISLSFNPPEPTHWLKRRFFDDNQWTEGNLLVHHSTHRNNPWLDEHYSRQLVELQQHNTSAYQTYALGNWSMPSSEMVFTNVHVHDFDLSAVELKRISFGIDFGYNHPFAMVKVGFSNDILYFLDELVVSQKTNTEVIRMNKEKQLLGENDIAYADSAEPKSIREWQIAGYNVQPAYKGPDSVRYGFSFLKTYPLYVHKSLCPTLATELTQLRYRFDQQGQLTDDVYGPSDDAIAAARYATEIFWRNHKDQKKPKEHSDFSQLYNRLEL